MLRFIFIAVLFVAGAVVTAQADVYRWVDEHGQPHYSDQWVPGSEVIKTGKSHPPEFDTATHSAASGHADSPLSDQANDQATKQDVAKSREQQCKAAQARYVTAVQSRRIYKTAADGTRQYLPDPDAEAYRAQARKDVQDVCGSVPQVNFEAPAPPPTPVPQSDNP